MSSKRSLGKRFWLPFSDMFALCVLYVALLHVLVGDARQLANQIMLIVSYLTAGSICALAAGHSKGRLRRAWTWWAAGWFSFGVGQIIYGYLRFVQHSLNPFPTLGDFFFLLAYPFIVLGVTTFPSTPTTGVQRLKLWLDGAVGAGALLGISWFFLVGPIFFAGSNSAFNLAVSLGYPLGDVAVLFGLNLLALRGVAKPYRLMYLVLTVGMLCYVAIVLAPEINRCRRYRGTAG